MTKNCSSLQSFPLLTLFHDKGLTRVVVCKRSARGFVEEKLVAEETTQSRLLQKIVRVEGFTDALIEELDEALSYKWGNYFYVWSGRSPIRTALTARKKALLGFSFLLWKRLNPTIDTGGRMLDDLFEDGEELANAVIRFWKILAKVNPDWARVINQEIDLEQNHAPELGLLL